MERYHTVNTPLDILASPSCLALHHMHKPSPSGVARAKSEPPPTPHPTHTNDMRKQPTTKRNPYVSQPHPSAAAGFPYTSFRDPLPSASAPLPLPGILALLMRRIIFMNGLRPVDWVGDDGDDGHDDIDDFF